MDRKVLLPTIIAIATLLVAVVGATFAYYNVVTGTASGTATVTATSDAVALISLQGDALNLKLDLSAADITTNPVSDTAYYFSPEGSATKLEGATNDYQFGKLEVKNMPEGASYSCSAKVTISGTDNIKDYNEGEIKITLPSVQDMAFAADSGLTANDFMTFPTLHNSLKSSNTLVEDAYEKSYNLAFTLDSNGTYYFGVGAKITSKANEIQSWLTGIDATIKVKATDLACSAK